jgi:hypothetical protein
MDELADRGTMSTIAWRIAGKLGRASVGIAAQYASALGLTEKSAQLKSMSAVGGSADQICSG